MTIWKQCLYNKYGKGATAEALQVMHGPKVAPPRSSSLLDALTHDRSLSLVDNDVTSIDTIAKRKACAYKLHMITAWRSPIIRGFNVFKFRYPFWERVVTKDSWRFWISECGRATRNPF